MRAFFVTLLVVGLAFGLYMFFQTSDNTNASTGKDSKQPASKNEAGYQSQAPTLKNSKCDDCTFLAP